MTRPLLECGDCGSRDVATAMLPDIVKYGFGADSGSITVAVPVRHCNECDTEWLDGEGVAAKAQALKDHLLSLPSLSPALEKLAVDLDRDIARGKSWRTA